MSYHMGSKHLLVFDSIPFMGGSKIATETILQCCKNPNTRITVLTNDCTSWKWPKFQIQRLYEFPQLVKRERGIPYLVRHFILFLNILCVRIKYGKIDLTVGASGPGNDLSIFLAKKVLGFRVLQLILGPVAASRTIARCLMNTDHIYYLETLENGINQALSLLASSLSQLKQGGKIIEHLVLGLPVQAWPTAIQTGLPPTLFWGASLYKWKGLDVLLDAIKRIPENQRPQTHICYIRPKQTSLDVTLAPVEIAKVHWYETPDNLDSIRGQSNIFISTSDREPFGLSILEAMAAGLCVIIPRDGAYWDKQLIENQQCIKYKPGDSHDLMLQLLELYQDHERVQTLGQAAKVIAENYRADQLYKSLIERLEE